MAQHRSWCASAVALCIGSLGPGCTVDLGEETLFGRVVQQCELPNPAPVASQGSPLALKLADGPAFLFGETWLSDADAAGRFTRDNTVARVADVDAACAGQLDYVLGDDHLPQQAIALSDDEAANNAGSSDRIVLWPIGAFSFEGTAIVYYDKLLLHDGDYFDSTRIGTGVCTMTSDGVCVRATPGLFADEPTMLWRWPTPTWGMGAVLAKDGLAYLYSCEQHGDFDHRCRTARVDPAHATERDAYEYLKLDDSWSAQVEDAVADIMGPTALSVTWNDFTDSYTAYSVRLLDEDIALRRAAEPWGTWGDPLTLFDGVTPSSWFVGDLRVHPALQASDRDVVLTYHSNTESGSGNHLVVFRLGDRLRAGR